MRLCHGAIGRVTSSVFTVCLRLCLPYVCACVSCACCCSRAHRDAKNTPHGRTESAVLEEAAMSAAGLAVGVSNDVEDELDAICRGLVREYLVRKGLLSVLSAFDETAVRGSPAVRPRRRLASNCPWPPPRAFMIAGGFVICRLVIRACEVLEAGETAEEECCTWYVWFTGPAASSGGGGPGSSPLLAFAQDTHTGHCLSF